MFTELLPDSYPELEVERIQDRERRQRALATRRAFRRQKVRRMLKRVA